MTPILPFKNLGRSCARVALNTVSVSAILVLNMASQMQAESQHLGSLIPKTEHGVENFGEGKLFDGLIVQGNWSWKVGRDPGTPESYRWNDPDYEMAFGSDRNMNLKYQGIWYPAQSRDWHTPEVIKEELEKYTRAIFERYYVERGLKFDILRVINEVGAEINRRPELEEALLEEGQVDETGYDWLTNLFSMVRGIADEYDPDVQLFINDYGLLGGATIKPGRLIDMINIVNSAEGGPYIDALGCQAHGLENNSAEAIKGNLDRFADALPGVDIYITEYDVNLSSDSKQQAVYMDQFPVMWEHPQVTSVALWGFEEGHMWSVKPNAFLVREDGTDRPAMTWLRAYMNSTNTAPVASFNTPESTNQPLGSDVAVQVQANDRDGVTKVDLFVNNVFVGTQSKTYEMDGYGKHDFIVSDLAEGPHTLRAVAYDTNGLSTTIEKDISIVSLTPPTEVADLIIYPEADAYVRIGNFSTRNYGTDSTLVARNKGGVSGRRETYLRFDLSSLPDTIESVWLELTVSSLANSDAGLRASFVSDDSWGETSINYSNRPATAQTLSTVEGITGTGDVIFFMGAQAITEASNDGKISIHIEETSDNKNFSFHSKEYTGDLTLRPRLLVYLDSTPLPPYSGDVPISDGLVLHMDASTLTERNEGDAVAEWPNLVPGGRSATAEIDQEPLFAEGFFNGSDALRFDGIDDWMNIGNLVTESSGAEIFVITQASETDGETNQRIISAFDSGNDDWTAPNWTMLRNRDADGNPLEMIPQLKNISGPDLHAAGVKLGRNGFASRNYFDGDIAEIVIFDRVLEDAERDEVANHLLQKYNIESVPSPDPDPTKEIYVFLGQSNCAGRGAITENEKETFPNVYLLNADDEFEIASNEPYGYNRYSNIRKVDDDIQKLGFAYSFGKTLSATYPEKDFGFVVNARGGTFLSRFLKGGDRGYYEKTLERIQNAMQYGEVRAVLWHQGEQDEDTAGNRNAYLERFESLVNDLRTDLGIPDLPFIAGQPNDNFPRIKEIIASIPQNIARTDYVSSEGLTLADYYHFDTGGQIILGERYAEKIVALYDSGELESAPLDTPVLVGTLAQGSVSLDWANSNRDGVIFNVYRKNSLEEAFGLPIATGVISSDYTDESVDELTTYFYAASAVDVNGIEWFLSEPLEVTTLESLDPSDGDIPIRVGLVLHLDASQIIEVSDGDFISTWNDLSDASNNATNSGDARPTFVQNALNGGPVIRFDGNNDWLDIGDIRDTEGAIDVFIVGQSNDATGGNWQRMIAAHDSGNEDFPAPNWNLLRTHSNGVPVTFAPAIITKSETAGHHIAGLKIGRHGSSSRNYYGGDIAEVVIFDRSLKEWERNEIGYYLAQKHYVDSGAYIDPDKDDDFDGLINRYELLIGTQYDDPNSRLDLQSLMQGQDLNISLDSVAGRQYTLQRSLDLRTWEDVETLDGIDASIEFSEDTQTEPKSFYRISVSQP
ncbi:MAG: sialate O-acetylesterase [Opitutales bacterium]